MGEPKATRDSCPADMRTLIEDWQAATAWWQALLGQPSDEAVNWQPFNHSHSIGGVLLHLAETEGLWIEECLAGRKRSEEELITLGAAQTRPSEGVWMRPPGWAFSRYLEILAWIRQRSIKTLSEYSDSKLTFEGPSGPTTIEQTIRHLKLHEAYHAGQAVLHRIHHEWGGVEPD